MATTAVVNRKVVSHAEWLAARKAFLKKEKEFTRLRDELSKQRRELPWERVEKKYVFDGPTGKESHLAKLIWRGTSMMITVPTITLEGDANGAPHPDDSAYASKFSDKYAHRIIRGGRRRAQSPTGSPQAFAQAVMTSIVFDCRIGPAD